MFAQEIYSMNAQDLYNYLISNKLSPSIIKIVLDTNNEEYIKILSDIHDSMPYSAELLFDIMKGSGGYKYFRFDVFWYAYNRLKPEDYSKGPFTPLECLCSAHSDLCYMPHIKRMVKQPNIPNTDNSLSIAEYTGKVDACKLLTRYGFKKMNI